MKDGFHLGQTGIRTDNCSVSQGGKDVMQTGVQMRTGDASRTPSDGSIPGNAMAAGHEAKGARLYSRRGRKDGQDLTIGTDRPGCSGRNLGDSGRDYTNTPFDILTD